MRASSVLCCAVLLSATGVGCVVSVDGWGDTTASLWGHEVEDHDGVLQVDGVRLEYDRWEELELDVGGLDRLAFGTATGALRLSGDEGAGARLRVHIHSELEGDGEVVFEEGRLVARSDEGTVFINDVEGTVPRGLALSVATGTGEIVLTDVARAAELKLSTGTGEMALQDVAPAALELESGTGNLRALGGGAEAMKAATGTGDVRLMEGRWGTIRMETGTGDLVITGCETGSVHLESGTGDLVLDGGTCGKVRLESGTGDLIVRGGADVAEQSWD